MKEIEIFIPCREYDPPGLWCAACVRGDVKNCHDPIIRIVRRRQT